MSLLAQKKWTESEPLLRECLAVREKKETDDWRTFNTKSMLGGALLGQKKYAEAEPLLLAGYEGIKKQEKTMPPRGNTRTPKRSSAWCNFARRRARRTTRPGGGRSWRPERRRNRSQRRRNHDRVRVQCRAEELPCRFTTGLAFAPTDFTIFIKRGPPTWLRH